MPRVWVTMSNLRRSTRSAIAPPIAPRKSRGILSKNPTIPSNKADLVNCQTSQLCATFCMKSPAFESNAPISKRRKLRWRNERSVWNRIRLSISLDGEGHYSVRNTRISSRSKAMMSYFDRPRRRKQSSARGKTVYSSFSRSKFSNRRAS